MVSKSYFSKEHQDLRSQIVLLANDIEMIAPTQQMTQLQDFYRDGLDNCLLFASNCDLGGVLTAYDFSKGMERAILSNLPSHAISTISNRFSLIEKALKQAITEDVMDSCECKLRV